MAYEFEPVCYKKNFLKEVIVRVDLLSPMNNVAKELPGELSDIASKTFPIAEPREAINREVNFGLEGVATTENKFMEWRFHARDRTKTLTITQNSFFIRYTSYKTYDVVKDDIVKFVDCVDTLFPGTRVSRIGLRYINAIELKGPGPTRWSPYIASRLLSSFSFPLSGDRAALSRVFHNIEFAFDSFNLRFLFGIHNPDYPARIRRKIFILDYDAYAHSEETLPAVGSLIDNFHAKIQQYFEHSIKDKLRSIMDE